MGKEDFINQLHALGFNVQELANNFIGFEYEIPVGKFSGQKVSLAFQFDNGFPMNPPSGGPHFKPLLLPKTGGGGAHPFGAIHDSPLGAEWEYWSRPFKDWNKTEKSAKAYMAHIRNLLATIP
jgi:hypothetical protein